MNRIILASIFTLFFMYTYSQDVYLLDNNKSIYRINMNYSLELITTLNFQVADIAISPDGTFYGISSIYIYEIDTSNGNAVTIANLPTSNSGYNSLVCSNNFELYTINQVSREIYKYDIVNDTVLDVGYAECNTPGDLTFYKGNIIYQCGELQNIQKINAYNIDDNSVVTATCLDSLYRFYGLTNIYNSCDSNVIIGAHYNILYNIDIVNHNITQLSVIGSVSDIYGLASLSENLASNCSYKFNDYDCTNSLIKESSNITELTIYPNPTHDNIEINASTKIELVKIYNHTGQLIDSYVYPDKILNLGGLSKGIYSMMIYTNNKSKYIKIIKL